MKDKDVYEILDIAIPVGVIGALGYAGWWAWQQDIINPQKLTNLLSSVFTLRNPVPFVLTALFGYWVYNTLKDEKKLDQFDKMKCKDARKVSRACTKRYRICDSKLKKTKRMLSDIAMKKRKR